MSDTAWVRRQRLAAATLLLAHVGGLVAMALVHAAFIRRVYDSRSGVYRGAWLGPVAWITSVSGILLALGGVLLASRPEGRYPDRLAPIRLFLWVGSVPLLLLSGFELLQSTRLIRGPWLPGWLHVLATSVTLLAAWGHLHELARRVPARRCLHAIFMLCLPLVLATAFWLFSPARNYLLFFLRVDPWRRPAWPWTVGTLVYVPWAAVMLGYCWVLLRSAARDADRNWVSDP
jgi:hypothetical protein